ncbi:MAG: PLxRFG domain-containing protein [Methylibium sp.]|nr:PLxRFG domain-containing protein [Methylibium sp.]
MGSLTSCVKKAGTALGAEDKAAILASARELRGAGVKTDDAATQAVDRQIKVLQGMLAGARGAAEAPTPVAPAAEASEPAANEQDAQTDDAPLLSIADEAERNALKAIAENDELFALPKPTGTTVEAIAAEIDPQIKVGRNTGIPGETRYKFTMPDGKTARMSVRPPNPYGPSLYGFTLVDGEMTRQITERPGENPEGVDPAKGDVWIDVSLLESGGAGTRIYAIAAAYAHNTERIFIGDPAGLSDEAMRRRPEQMLSSALKFGTTEHLAPHPRQIAGDAKLGVPPLAWVYGDDLANIRSLIDVNLAALDNAFPTAKNVGYDLSTGKFTDATRGGRHVPVRNVLSAVDKSRSRSAGQGPAGVALAGGRTVARGAVFRALLREEGRAGEAGGRRDGLLARLAKLGSDLGSPARADRIFYSRPDVDATRAQSSTPEGKSQAKGVDGKQRARENRGNASPAHQRLAATLQQRLQTRYPGTVLHAVDGAVGRGGQGSRPLAAAATAAKRLYGHDVVFVEFDGAPLFNGAMSDAIPGAVFIRADSDKPHMAILGHELLHQLRKNRPDLYAALNTRLSKLLKNEQRFVDALDAKYAGTPKGTPGNVLEELHADIVGDNFMDPEFWRLMSADKPGLFKRVVNAILKFLDDVAASVGTSRPFGTEQFLSDIAAAREAVADAMRDFSANRVEQSGTASEGVKLSRADATESAAFKRWFGQSKVVDAHGKPLVVYHGTNHDVSAFNPKMIGDNFAADARGFFFTTDPKMASEYAENDTVGVNKRDGANVMPAYVSLQKPLIVDDAFLRKEGMAPIGKDEDTISFWDNYQGLILEWVDERKADGVILVDNSYKPTGGEPTRLVVAFKPKQIKSATGNRGTFDPDNANINLSIADAMSLNNVREARLPAGYIVGDLFKSTGKLDWWQKTIGTPFNLAQKNPTFKRVFDGVQNFIGDVSHYATEAADLAPTILPKLDKFSDIAKSPLSAEDTQSLAAPVFEGTLVWARDAKGRPVKVAELEEAAKRMPVEDKARGLLRGKHITPQVLKMWQGLPMEQYQAIIDGKYEREMLKSGVVWSDAEMSSLFKMTPEQIALYREFRSATDKSLTSLAISDMLRFGGKDVASVREQALAAGDVDKAAELLRDHLFAAAEADPKRADVLNDTANTMIDKADRARDLMKRGYAPLSRFGNYTVYVTEGGEQRYFGMFESQREANRMGRQMRREYPNADIQQGTVSQEAFKLFAGVSPETLELFGDMIGLEAQGDGAASQAFQAYLKLAKSNRSAMKRLIQRKGIAGFSEDAGRVLAGFVYSNARQTSANLHMGEMTEATAAIPQGQGELKDYAVRMTDYVKNPQEEAQAFRGLLFAQYLGGSVASAMVNMMAPIQVTFPYLSQFGGARKAAANIARAMKDIVAGTTGDDVLDKALKQAELDGIVSPQEVFHLMAQAQGRGSLRAGDGTLAGDAAAKAGNAMAKLSLAWGKMFGFAEQINRRSTFIAAYRMAVDQGKADPAKFAEEAVNATQFVYNKGNRPRWARGAVGATLFVFKTYSVSYIELIVRMAQSGPEGRKAALLALGVLFVMSGADELPFLEDVEDVIDGGMQRLGYDFSLKRSRNAVFVDLLGKDVAAFVEKGVSGFAGVPIDASSRFGMGNLIPGTGVFLKKDNYTRDLGEMAGAGGDFAARAFKAGGQLLGGQPVEAAKSISPVAVRNATIGWDMMSTGMYRDARGRKVIDTEPFEAAVKAIGFQPNSVGKVQDATWQVQRSVALNKVREAEIADVWARGLFEKNADKVKDAREMLKNWNRNNPESRIDISIPQLRRRVMAMNQDKATRLAKTAPKEIRQRVKEELGQ